jgi:DNA-binding transcriptional ArsR family regulator
MVLASVVAIQQLIQIDRHLQARFHALGDATGFAVVERLLHGPASASELAASHPIALPPFMKHLRVLEDAGQIRLKKQGRVRTCSIRADAFDDLDAWFRDRRGLWRARFDRLESQLRKEAIPTPVHHETLHMERFCPSLAAPSVRRLCRYARAGGMVSPEGHSRSPHSR